MKVSRRKKKASRENGRQGGRPRIPGGPSDLAAKLGVSRQRAAQIIAKNKILDAIKTHIES